MARHYFTEEEISRLAIWARRLALFSLVGSVLVIGIVNAGLLELYPALTTFAAVLGVAVLGMLLAFAAFAVIWVEGLRGIGHALTAILIGVGLLAYPSYLGLKAYRLPWIYDITTDPIDPPRYEALAKVRPRDANPVIYAGLSAAEQQRAAYPEIEPLDADATPQDAYQAALAVVTKRKWRIVEQRAPGPGRREGRIEAVARSTIMGFRDDVVVRVRGDATGTRIDARSSSRYGSFDFGSNADRVRSLIDDIDDAIGAQKSERLQPPKKAVVAPKRPQTPVAKR
jgi:uncharacterized protein (DUF1499 family)